MPVESVYPRLEPLLPLVRKPIQYVGGELNAVVKDWDAADVRWALMYPDAYEVGIANQGIQILYEVLNERDGVLAERTYSVWPDLEDLMRAHGIGQFTVDGHRPVRAFDVLGVSFATELGYTNLLTALDLAGIPLLAAQRGEGHPLVIAGGHAAFNPEPIAEFIDGAVLGDGEQAVLAITELIRDWKAAGRPGGRDGLLRRWPPTAGCTCRASTTWTTCRTGGSGGSPRTGRRRRSPSPSTPSWTWTTGRTRDGRSSRWPSRCTSGSAWRSSAAAPAGCRFCQAGMITRPVRERSDHRDRGDGRARAWPPAASTRSACCRCPARTTARSTRSRPGLADRYEGTNTGLSLPSTRVDAFNITLANELSRNGRRSGLTFAPEGGSERMRKVINKMVTEEDLIRTVTTAYGSGWRQVKLYFMCGLPTETDEDVLADRRTSRGR